MGGGNLYLCLRFEMVLRGVHRTIKQTSRIKNEADEEKYQPRCSV